MPNPAFEAAFEKVSKLAATFQANEARYADYQEAEARKDFIDKLFIALGWDVRPFRAPSKSRGRPTAFPGLTR